MRLVTTEYNAWFRLKVIASQRFEYKSITKRLEGEFQDRSRDSSVHWLLLQRKQTNKVLMG
jgi:hypothetical protein